VEKLWTAFQSLSRNASAGIDGVTHAEYESSVEENIRQLHRRLVEGKYRAQPLRRVYIPKDNGQERPISIPLLRTRSCRKRLSTS
jgi:RNA-directed DNA polymerase